MWLLDFVREKEGFREEAYQDIIGVWTVGYGFTRIDGRAVREGDSMSKKQATELLGEELLDIIRFVEKFGEGADYDWNKRQVGALASFCFNLGQGALAQVTDGGTRSNEVIAEKMRLYYNAGGKKVRGLEIRRNEEADHFLS